MPAYDESLDQIVQVLGEFEVPHHRKVRVALRSYNGGEPKMEILLLRFKKKTETWAPTKGLRLDLDEAKAVLAAMCDVTVEEVEWPDFGQTPYIEEDE